MNAHVFENIWLHANLLFIDTCDFDSLIRVIDVCNYTCIICVKVVVFSISQSDIST